MHAASISPDSLDDLHDLMEEKELRIRAPLDEIDLLLETWKNHAKLPQHCTVVAAIVSSNELGQYLFPTAKLEWRHFVSAKIATILKAK